MQQSQRVEQLTVTAWHDGFQNEQYGYRCFGTGGMPVSEVYACCDNAAIDVAPVCVCVCVALQRNVNVL